MARETGKQRSQRIQIDYYRHKGGFDRLKSACVIAGLAGAGLYVAYVLTAAGASHLSTGPLATAHASFENDCQECHEDFTPIDPSGAKLDLEFVGIKSSDSIRHIESACQECHQVGDHYRNKMKPHWQVEDQNCAGCHADHKGRDQDLTLVASQKCTSCHANLAEGCQGNPKVLPNVTAFGLDHHGDFGSLAKGDPGTIKFDHHQHMLPGQVDEGVKGAFTIGMLEESLKARYRANGQTDVSPVTLDCSSCHELSGNPDRLNSLASDSDLGRYLAPVSFEKHCAACHAMSDGVPTDDSRMIPHADTWSKVELLIGTSLKGKRLSGNLRVPRDDRQTTPLPGVGTGKPASQSSMANDQDYDIDLSSVKSQCLKCHDEQGITDEAISAGLAGTSAPMIPPRWFKHGMYDHAAHFQVDCQFCHADAYAKSGPSGKATDQDHVMISGIESCSGCHRDPQTPAPNDFANAAFTDQFGGLPTWSSDQCTMCHRYHTSLPPGNMATTMPLAEARP